MVLATVRPVSYTHLVAHLGDLGHVSGVDGLQNIDVLLVPIGGFYTIDTGAAIQVIERVKPRIAIPMHFKTPCLDGNFPIADEARFCALTGATRAKSALSLIHISRTEAATSAGSLLRSLRHKPNCLLYTSRCV